MEKSNWMEILFIVALLAFGVAVAVLFFVDPVGNTMQEVVLSLYRIRYITLWALIVAVGSGAGCYKLYKDKGEREDEIQ